MSEICPVKLYHGTSSIFLPSILEKGLGAINVVKEWGILDLAREIFPLVQKEHSDPSSFFSFKRMVQQTCTNGCNFQHGDVYLSASPWFAARFAAFNKQGSEILTYTLSYVQDLLDAKNTQINPILAKYPTLMRLLTVSSEPLVIELEGISYEELLSEDGKPVEQAYKNQLKDFSEEFPNNDDYLRLFEYRLISIVPKSNLKVYKVEALNELSAGFEYNLIPYHPQPSQEPHF